MAFPAWLTNPYVLIILILLLFIGIMKIKSWYKKKVMHWMHRPDRMMYLGAYGMKKWQQSKVKHAQENVREQESHVLEQRAKQFEQQAKFLKPKKVGKKKH